MRGGGWRTRLSVCSSIDARCGMCFSRTWECSGVLDGMPCWVEGAAGGPCDVCLPERVPAQHPAWVSSFSSRRATYTLIETFDCYFVKKSTLAPCACAHQAGRAQLTVDADVVLRRGSASGRLSTTTEAEQGLDLDGRARAGSSQHRRLQTTKRMALHGGMSSGAG